MPTARPDSFAFVVALGDGRALRVAPGHVPLEASDTAAIAIASARQSGLGSALLAILFAFSAASC
jgi:hypothetical protein